MMTWLHDPASSRQAGKIIWKRPYPRADWLEDKKWNKRPLEWVQAAYDAMKHFSIPVEKWQQEQFAFYQWMLEETAN